MKTPTPREIICTFPNKEQGCDICFKQQWCKDTLDSLRECVLAKKIDKKSVMHQLDIESHIREYNKALEDIANLFGEGK